MALTEINTEKVPGRITHVYIGYDSTHGVDIKSGIKIFKYSRINDDNIRLEIPGKATRDNVQQLGMSFFTWRLEFVSDCRTAFFATDVQAGAGNQYAMDDDGLSNKIEFFRVIMEIQDGSGAIKTRTYIITGGYALRNGAQIGDDETAIYWYEGDADYISYSDA